MQSWLHWPDIAPGAPAQSLPMVKSSKHPRAGMLQDLRRIATQLGAHASSSSSSSSRGGRVVLLDTRQELFVHLAGSPVTRREAELPTAPMGHSGFHWRELRKLEQWLQEDVRASGEDWAVAGRLRVMVHSERKVRGLRLVSSWTACAGAR